MSRLRRQLRLQLLDLRLYHRMLGHKTGIVRIFDRQLLCARQGVLVLLERLSPIPSRRETIGELDVGRYESSLPVEIAGVPLFARELFEDVQHFGVDWQRLLRSE